MDFSDYPKEHINYDATNKKVLGKFKDEVNGKLITELIGLKPKMYAFKVQVDKEQKKQKVFLSILLKKKLILLCIKRHLKKITYPE